MLAEILIAAMCTCPYVVTVENAQKEIETFCALRVENTNDSTKTLVDVEVAPGVIQTKALDVLMVETQWTAGCEGIEEGTK